MQLHLLASRLRQLQKLVQSQNGAQTDSRSKRFPHLHSNIWIFQDLEIFQKKIFNGKKEIIAFMEFNAQHSGLGKNEDGGDSKTKTSEIILHPSSFAPPGEMPSHLVGCQKRAP